MSLHKPTAGSGYDYLTRQVAALDATDKGHTGLASYYTERGESPGVWVGSGMGGNRRPGRRGSGDGGADARFVRVRVASVEPRLRQLEGAGLTGQGFKDVMRLGHRSRSSTMRRRSGSRWPSGSLLQCRDRPAGRRLGRGG